MTLRNTLELFKLRIGFMIALTAMVGYAAVAEDISVGPLLVLGLAMLLGSASSSVFNHFYDRDIDRLMVRTQKRPLASGAMRNPAAALWLAGVLLVAGLWLAAGSFNWAVAVHLFLGAFVYGVVYTVWLKRRTWLNIVIGGAAGSFAILAGAAAVDPNIWLLPTLMAVTLFLWTPSHFWALAILLKDDYAKAGVPMLPVLVGEARCARWILINTVALVASAALPWVLGELGWLYGVLATAAGLRFLWLNVRLCRDPGPAMARRTFLGSMQYLGAVFLAVVLDKHLPAIF
ncbi:heme o synthase [Novispirillum sp. DQ9]|uniref:heme o synthase n=1 Tax=Novispirillum sp. DQ9 TaxID=3398612 RepID=UPI003C7D57DA